MNWIIELLFGLAKTEETKEELEDLFIVEEVNIGDKTIADFKQYVAEKDKIPEPIKL